MIFLDNVNNVLEERRLSHTFRHRHWLLARAGRLIRHLPMIVGGHPSGQSRQVATRFWRDELAGSDAPVGSENSTFPREASSDSFLVCDEQLPASFRQRNW